MTDETAPQPGPAIRASDADRDQSVALLQRGYADGRLTLAELEERVTAAYAANTWDKLRALTTDLPADLSTVSSKPTPPVADAAAGPDAGLLCLLLCLCPPAGLAYWLLCRRCTRPGTRTADDGSQIDAAT